MTDTNDALHAQVRKYPLYALMLKLRPRAAGNILPNAGQLAHAALLRWLADVDPALATRLHEPNQDRPFTCSSLWFPDERAVNEAQSANRRLPVSPGHTYWLRMTLLTDEIFRTLTARFLRPVAISTGHTGDLDPGLPSLRLGGLHFDVAELLAMPPDSPDQRHHQPETWAGYDTYEALVARAAARSLDAPDGRSIALAFHSPTAFSDGQRTWGKRMHLFPDPERVFDRLARVWNAWAPSALALDAHAVQAYATEWVAVASFDLHTRLLHFDRHSQLGFTGRCGYALMERAHAADDTASPGAGLRAVQALHLLASFAFYAGIGQKTTMGMGQARVLPASITLPAATPARAAVPRRGRSPVPASQRAGAADARTTMATI